LTKKTSIADKIHGSVEASAFNSFVKDLGEMPKVGFNIVDKTILSRLRYCQGDGCIYVRQNGKLKLIGKLESLKKDPTQNGLCLFIKEEIGRQWYEGVPKKLDEYVSECFKSITDLRHFIIAETKKRIDAGEDFNDIVIDIGDEKFKPAEKCYAEDANAIENAANNICIEKLWEIAPGSLFTAKFLTVKAMFNTYEIQKSNGSIQKVNEFVKYIYDVVRSGEALTEAAYLKNVFSVYASELKDDDMFKLEDVPRTYADDSSASLFKYDEELLKKSLEGIDFYKKLEDCPNIMLLKSWMNEDEFRLTMAWAYAAVHPCTVKSNIALLLWTGGGTGKSSIVAMIKYAMMLAAGAREQDLYFEIKGDKFDEDMRNWIPEGELGLPKAALVNIDEATTASIELYKNFSGSADKNRLNIRANYENAVTYDVKGKFVFTTNKGLQLSSDDGSLLRRVALIKHTDIQNIIGDKPMTNDEIVLEYKKQILMLLAAGKKALKEIEELGYKSIDEYAMKCENINKNLQESTSTSANTEIYQQLFNWLDEKVPHYKQTDGCYRLQGNFLRKLYEIICRENGDDYKYFASFKHFVLERSSLFTHDNSKKACKNFMKLSERVDTERKEFIIQSDGDVQFIKKTYSSIYELYPLKDPIFVKPADEAEETDKVAKIEQHEDIESLDKVIDDVMG